MLKSFFVHPLPIRAFLLLLYAAQVGQAFLPAPQRTGLEACPYLCRMRYTNWRNALSESTGTLELVGQPQQPGFIEVPGKDLHPHWEA